MNNILEFEKPIYELENKIIELQNLSRINKIDLEMEINMLKDKSEKIKLEIYGSLSAWEKVKISRHQDRPHTLDYIKKIIPDFMEFHGDRYFGDDSSIVGGIGTLDGISITVIGQQKGRDINENITRNFGMAHPEGYRKALRLMKQAEKFNRPVITFIDTPGAYCGLEAEERGQGEAIAINLMEMSRLRTPIISIVIGEGGSGGALGLGIADRLLMLENSIYSVISPEGLASILWKDAILANRAADVMKLTAEDLLSLKIIDGIIKESLGGADKNLEETTNYIKIKLITEMQSLRKLSIEELLENRYNKLRNIGDWN